LPAVEPRRDPADSDLDLLASAAKEAGAVALTFFRRNPANWMKENDSPVSDADIAVDRLLRERLRAARPDYGWFSEETVDDASRRSGRPVFIVDPIDGTREFLAGRNEWAISIAVVANGRPVAAVLAVPALRETFASSAGGGAWLNGMPVTVPRRDSLAGVKVAGPRRYVRQVAEKAGIDIRAVRFIGSLAYRLALVAVGRVDIAAAREGARDWDLAAADLIVHEAGGKLTDLEGRILRYDRADTRHPSIVAAPAGIAGETRRLIAAEVAALNLGREQEAGYLE
jgi:myo-inositol-1(or 4)-monophosphatase